MIASLDVCLNVLSGKSGMLSASELRIKTMLSTIRGELKEHALKLQAESGSRSY